MKAAVRNNPPHPYTVRTTKREWKQIAAKLFRNNSAMRENQSTHSSLRNSRWEINPGRDLSVATGLDPPASSKHQRHRLLPFSPWPAPPLSCPTPSPVAPLPSRPSSTQPLRLLVTPGLAYLDCSICRTNRQKQGVEMRRWHWNRAPES